jgi:hypothetical protein
MRIFDWLFRRQSAVDAPEMLESLRNAASRAASLEAQLIDAERRLMPSALGAMLRMMGYEPESSNVSENFTIRIMHNNWETVITVSVSPNRQILWLACAFTIAEPDRTPNATWMKLLGENFNIGPAHFALQGNVLQLQQPFDNRGVTPPRLRQQIEQFDAILRQTATLWGNPANFGTTVTDIVAKPSWPAI